MTMKLKDVTQEFKNEEGVNEENTRNCKIVIKGNGAKLTQGVISKEDYWYIKEFEEFEEISKEEAWFCAINDGIIGFESEKYFTDNLRSFFNGPYLDEELDIEIWIDDKLVINTKMKNLKAQSEFINISLDGNKCCDEDDIEKILVTYADIKTNMIMEHNFKLKGDFNWDKFNLLVGHSDEVAIGFDYGDFLLGIKYDENIFEPHWDKQPYQEANTIDIEVDYDLIYFNGINQL